MENGLVWKNGELYYYENGVRRHAGIVKDGDKIYYISRDGKAVRGQHIVHRRMANGIVKRGTYTFADDCTLIRDSYIPPKKAPKKRRRKRRKQFIPFAPSSSSHKLKAKELLVVFGCITAVLAVILTALLVTAPSPPVDTSQGTALSSSAIIRLSLPNDADAISLCNESVTKWQNGTLDLEHAVERGDFYRAIKIHYEFKGQDGTFLLSENADLSDAVHYPMPKDSYVLTLDNLKTSTTYFYRVTVGNETKSGHFTTADTPRFLSFQNLANTRDIGGYRTLDGKTVKQNMLIRGTELDSISSGEYYLKSTSRPLIDAFKFAHEMDLRPADTFSGVYLSYLGTDVSHRFYNAPSYGMIFNDDFKQSLREIFTALADSSNYPMYVHCSYGVDRTGTVIYLLQGLLNLSEDDMNAEYQLSAFAFDDIVDINQLDVITQRLDTYPGDTLQQKIEYFLLTDIGVTEEEIASIRSILLEN